MYGTFYMLFAQSSSYFVIILFSFMFVLVDTGMSYLHVYINKWYLSAVDKAEKE